MKSKPATRIVFETDDVAPDEIRVRFCYTEGDALNAAWLEDRSGEDAWDVAMQRGRDSDTSYGTYIDGTDMHRLLSDMRKISTLVRGISGRTERGRSLIMFELRGQFTTELGFVGEVRELLDMRSFQRLNGVESFEWENPRYEPPSDEDDEP